MGYIDGNLYFFKVGDLAGLVVVIIYIYIYVKGTGFVRGFAFRMVILCHVNCKIYKPNLYYASRRADPPLIMTIII